jgi:hypothetical protein
MEFAIPLLIIILIFILFPYYINSMEVAIRLKNGISILFPMKTTLFP